MSIVQNIIDIVEKETSASPDKRVMEVQMEIGVLAGVEYEALDFALKVMAPGTIIEGAEISVHRLGGQAVCDDCLKDFETDSPINSCPECGSYRCSILKGKELRLSSILVE